MAHTRQALTSCSRLNLQLYRSGIAPLSNKILLVRPPPSRKMSNELGIESTDVKSAPGVTLSEQQKTVVGSVLDLFAGKPTVKKLSLWDDKATFEDPICIAEGRERYEPQWYGLAKGFSEIERLHHEVTSSGNPIEMDLKMRYVIAGINKQQDIESKVTIAYNESSGKITKLEDKWNGKLPESSFTEALRKFNGMAMPKVVSVPKSD